MNWKSSLNDLFLLCFFFVFFIAFLRTYTQFTSILLCYCCCYYFCFFLLLQDTNRFNDDATISRKKYNYLHKERRQVEAKRKKNEKWLSLLFLLLFIRNVNFTPFTHTTTHRKRNRWVCISLNPLCLRVFVCVWMYV